MKVALVTGAGGFIGRALVKRLERVPDLRVLQLMRSRPMGAHASADIFVGSLDEAFTSEFWVRHNVSRIDVLYHLAAFAPKDARDAVRSTPIISSNIVGIARLLDSLPAPLETLVFASSVDVYERFTGRAINETTATAPRTLYGASKVFGEHLIAHYSQASGCRAAILRLGHIFGPGEGSYRKIIPVLIQKMLQGLVPEIAGDGSVTRDYLFVSDAAEAIVRASLFPEVSGVINVVRGESITIRHLANLIAAQCGYNGNIHYSENPTDDTLTFDSARMRKMLKLKDLVSIEDGLRSEVEYFRAEAL